MSEDGSKFRQWAAERISVGRVWLGGGVTAEVPPPTDLPPEPPPPPPLMDMTWSMERVKAAESIWGEGFIMPGGAKEVISLTRPLNLTSESSLLLMGSGSGGAARTVITTYGSRVSTLEADPQLAELARTRLGRSAKLSARLTSLEWKGPLPTIRAQAFDRTLALWPLRGEPDVSLLLARLFRSLRPWGQIMMVDLVADTPLDPSDPVVAGWSVLERRPALLPSEAEMAKLLKSHGLNVTKSEDVSEEHARMALSGWDAAVRAMQETRPTRAQAARLVSEAELWLLRLRLLREKRIRVMQWFAFSRG